MANYLARTEVEMFGFYLQLHDFSLQTVNLIFWMCQQEGRWSTTVFLRSCGCGSGEKLLLFWPNVINLGISIFSAPSFSITIMCSSELIWKKSGSNNLCKYSDRQRGIKVRKIFIPQTWQHWIAVQNGVQNEFQPWKVCFVPINTYVTVVNLLAMSVRLRVWRCLVGFTQMELVQYAVLCLPKQLGEWGPPSVIV